MANAGVKGDIFHLIHGDQGVEPRNKLLPTGKNHAC